ncbi:hypothetical protein [Streptomyces sp. B3I8]|uniref:hypothetical protein n=1 Tax=Streptomyces sp. B3I8 TaxID=3042303 RepID=UPI002780C2F6|nr:hypothetical protein [Streptomyces sp. B3I8]MDQ0790361.1 hypothetical protein [Streptomyces sp. B3I8]
MRNLVFLLITQGEQCGPRLGGIAEAGGGHRQSACELGVGAAERLRGAGHLSGGRAVALTDDDLSLLEGDTGSDQGEGQCRGEEDVDAFGAAQL